jgi:hypothetical protein
MSNTVPGALDALKERWRVDKTISGQALVVLLLTALAAMIGNIATVVWFARGVVAETEALADAQQKDRERITVLEGARNAEGAEKMANASRMAVLENRAVTTEAAVLRVEADVKKLLERRRETP